ncbi:MAG: division/cell wall cluster transcriptional repressor MraZ [Selenomonadales bacterium]|jgi:MraZ protein|nr:division/cell wall cluster transcriptional repressor MraZ [Selenomonadales bacterium]
MWGKGVKKMLLGEYAHALDDKGRLFIPAKLREVLGKHFYLCKGFDGCLMVYDEEAWQRFADRLNALPMGQKKARDIKRFFFSGASDVSCDKQGRVLLAASLRRYASIDKDVVIIGVGDKAEIWAAETWQEKDRQADQEMAAELEDLDLDL